ncbi:uncharacterized protein LOC121529819 [Drosophila eugracilis]|uniref:uncharacterized protein LOC121529819 n=1 Tax=Drosophila eugracilis TaxID=29029 RepID=UPI001BD97183|nr:uncharacterized protein LOC121529819 [Drosophila eugracilis]
MSSWVYQATKAELVEYASEFGVDPSGGSRELRQRLSTYTKSTEHTEEIRTRLMEVSSKYKKMEIPGGGAQVEPDSKRTATKEETQSMGDRRKVESLDRVRSWGIRYQGTSNPLEFLGKMEEWATGYGIDKDELVQTMPFILEGAAEDWWNTTPSRVRTWEELRGELLEYFLPPRYQEQLDLKIGQLRQKEGEPTRAYAMELRKLMRFTSYSEKEKLDRIYKNCRSKIKLYAQRSGFASLTEFLTLAEEVEEIEATENQGHPAETRSHGLRPEICMRCGGTGHATRACGNPPRLFCWVCGRNERRTTECCRARPDVNRRLEQATLAVQDRALGPAGRGGISYDGFQATAEVRIGTKRAKGIVDTGASRSVIDQGSYRSLRKQGRWNEEREEITLANGARQKVMGSFATLVQFGSKRFKLSFLILDQVTGGMLLGMDFLAKVGTIIRCDHQEITIREPQEEQKRKQREEAGIKTEPSEEEIRTFLEEQMMVFERMKGCSTIATHTIYMKDERPVKQRYYPRNPKQQAIINEQVDELLDQGLIEPSRSSYSAPVVLVRKKNNEWRMCVDYRLLNEKTEKDAYPVPRMDFILNQLREAKFISTIDLKAGYWQIPMDEDSKQYTAFTVPGRGLFQWKVMPFGLTTAPATFQRALDTIIGPEMEPFAFAYLDDIVVIGRNKREHLEKLQEVFRRLQANLKINAEKCHFFQKELRYLGHIVTDQEIQTDPDKVAAIRELPTPGTTKEVHSFLGMASWYRKFIPGFSEQADPLQELIRKGRKFDWQPRHQAAFDQIKTSLTRAPVLACPDFTRQFVLQTDASDFGIGAVLTQENPEGERVIAYVSRRLNQAERNYSATEKECLAIYWRRKPRGKQQSLLVPEGARTWNMLFGRGRRVTIRQANRRQPEEARRQDTTGGQRRGDDMSGVEWQIQAGVHLLPTTQAHIRERWAGLRFGQHRSVLVPNGKSPSRSSSGEAAAS